MNETVRGQEEALGAVIPNIHGISSFIASV
jgi:hypothetical protein